MPQSIKALFGQSGTTDGLAQSQREAIVDLLHYCMYADNLVALKEDSFINSVAATLSWDPNISFETYEGGSISNARRAKEQASYRADFLKSITTRLGPKEVRQLAFDLAKQLFSVDGNLSPSESQQLPGLRTALDL